MISFTTLPLQFAIPINKTLGYIWFKDSSFLPSDLGGRPENTCDSVYSNYPNNLNVYGLEAYYGIQLGTHAYDVVWQILFTSTKERKYYEMLLHHLLAYVLVQFSFSMNFLGVGAVVLLLHDFSDIFLIMGRWYIDFKRKNMIIIALAYFSLLFAWGYTRIVLISRCVIMPTFRKLSALDSTPVLASIVKTPVSILLSMVFLLLIMNSFWLYILLSTGATLTRKKKVNTYDEVAYQEEKND